MKKIILLFFILSFSLSCKNNHSSTTAAEELSASKESFDWLLGSWQRINEQEGKQTFENWDKTSDIEYRGFGFTLQNSDTIWKENIKLVKRDTIWNFEVTGHGENQPTVFKIISAEGKSFDSENQENEFPKVISYLRDANNLKAIISGNGMEVPFDFIPVNQK